ncbi:MAG: serine/threonine-protein kinase KIN2 [Sclerophora amabilis]|nr:MAG: serine/threonine-protein kinase KIN2 [Sclerophora amabilis]
MSAASSATPAILQRNHSSSRRGQSYATPAPTAASAHPTRPPSISKPPATPNSTQRAESHAFGSPSSSPHQQQQLNNVLPRRDYETSNLARPPSSRRSSSRDASSAAQAPVRTASTRSTHRNSSRSSHNRYTSEMGNAPPAATNGESAAVPGSTSVAEHRERPPANSSSSKRRTTVTGQSGQWSLGNTIGAGSMGKVKLAKKLDTGEQVAVKIVPRQSVDDGNHSTRERDRQDTSKEIRTAREAAIVSLLDHPYICAMRDVVRTNYHWYMLFEYVNGGQMLDYIISHGRLKEKQARKFGRQIASALDYCHRNSIVHRDLKIENILISKTGDIKIIDFGLSNLFSPRSQLKTFCGSLYFAAPELLMARQYTGPEVDIWSFGIVLYVLVCGKVPFDDQSMPHLHAKIKKGVVDYPQWLSAECKNLISRMLVTDPRQRATLQEIMNHPWICKGFNSPPENYLPHREALKLPLEPEVIRGMTGFDFGPPDFIANQLTRVIDSEEYQNAVRNAARDQTTHNAGAERKRGFPTFDFYKRRNSTSRDTLTNLSAEAVHLGADPVNAFNPLVSIYYLVKEKQQRQRFETSPGAMAMPRSPGERPLKVPDLPAPEAVYTNSSSYEMPGETATGGRSRPRARTHGEDEVTESMKKVNLGAAAGSENPAIVTPQATQTPLKKESTAAGLLRRFSTRRNREPDREKPSKQQPPTLSVESPADATAPPRKSFSVRRARDKEAPPVSMFRSTGSQPQHQDLLSPANADRSARRGKGLGRSTSVNSADYRRRPAQRAVSEAAPSITLNDPPLTSGSDRSSGDGRRARASEPLSQDAEKSQLTPRTANMRAKSLGHARRESIAARRARREEAREANVPEETDQELGLSGGSGEVGERVASAENVKPVFLKGLFSVSTTSTKPVVAIRGEIVRVLKQLGVEYTEIRGGFRCRHTPSIDLNKVVDNEVPSPERATNAVHSPGHRRKISFGGFMGGGDRDEFKEQHRAQNPLRSAPRRPARDSSLTGSSSSNDSEPMGLRPTGETSTHVQSELGGSMVLDFEIIIVKVPILTLHGLQFKRMAGGTWQYKNMADKILKQLRL